MAGWSGLTPGKRGTRLLELSRKAVLAGLAGACAATTLAYAQFAPGDEADRVLFEADSLTRESEESPIIAEGNVKAYYGDRFLTADRVVYDPQTDTVMAYGNTSITDMDGQTFFADQVELTGDLGDGVAENFSALLAGNSRMAADTLVKEGDTRNVLTKAVYTSCDVCTDDGDPKTPTWQIKSFRVVQDRENQVIRFQNAFMEVFGVPIAYTPYLQIPDPSVKRQSGLLAPTFGSSSRTGHFLQVPYYWAISDYQDFTLSPKIMENQGVLYQGEYRLNDYRSGLVLNGGIIDARESNEYFITGRPGLNTPTTRFHLFGEGYQDFADLWTASFDVDYVSDKRYLGIYDIRREDDLATDLVLPRPDRLDSDFSLSRRSDRSLFRASMLGYQSLRFSENNDYVAQGLPKISYNGIFDAPSMIGGRFELDADLLALDRADGLDSRRAVASAGWERQLTSQSGHRFRVFGELRADAYNYSNVSYGTERCNPENLNDADFATCIAVTPDADEDDITTSRFLPTVGAEWTYPLARQTSNATYIIEPRIQLIASPDTEYSDEIINEDSQFFELDTTSLFMVNKSAGYDIWEDGQRANIGLAAQAIYPKRDLTVKGSIGQQFRTQENNIYEAYNLDTGIGETTSDIVAEVSVDWSRYLSWDNEFRYDHEDGKLRRAESRLTGALGPLSSRATYYRLESGASLPGEDSVQEFADATIAYEFWRDWTAEAEVNFDLARGERTRESYSITYSDECLLVELSYRYDPSRDIEIDFEESINFTILLTGFNF